MIKNERQFKVTKSALKNFEDSLTALKNQAESEQADEFFPYQVKALEDQIANLKEEISEYQTLLEKGSGEITVRRFSDIPSLLIKKRIALHLTQKDLAERLGMKEQQIQRYEANDYAGASLSTLKLIAKDLGLGETLDFKENEIEDAPAKVMENLKGAGFDTDFISRRFGFIRDDKTANFPELIKFITKIARVFNVDPTKLLLPSTGSLFRSPDINVSYSHQRNVNKKYLEAYSMYVHYLVLLVKNCISGKVQQSKFNDDPFVLRNEILAHYGKLDFESVLDFVWSKGIPVLPLADNRAFKGAAWKVSNWNMIVVKNPKDFEDRWIHLLLHEVWHVIEGQHESDFVEVDLENESENIFETSENNLSSDEATSEEAANDFAIELVLGENYEQYVNDCVVKCHGRMELLKNVVPTVANSASVSIGALADYLSYRVSIDNPENNWWGAATNLQTVNPSCYEIARDKFLKSVDLTLLNDIDREMITDSLQRSELLRSGR